MRESPIPELPPTNPVTLLRALFKRSSHRREPVFSPIQTEFEFEGIDLDHMKRYNDILGFKPASLPVTYYYLIAQRAHLATMLGKDFPFRIVGMVHVENDLVEHFPVAPGRSLRITTTVDIEPPNESGATFCVLQTVATDTDQPVFTCSSKYLAVRGERKQAVRGKKEEGQRGPIIGAWDLPSSAGRQYAAVSGDWNPIHLWSWSARLMGFRSPVIHGMHSIGKACAVLEAASGDRVVAISVKFKSYILLGSTVHLEAKSATNNFVVSCDGRRAVEGTFRIP